MLEMAQKKITLIPPKPLFMQTNTKQKKLLVAAYARVSTLKEEQEESYETQIRHYTNLIKSNSEWIFAGMYADRGLTGTKAEKRPQFMQMINEARAHRIDRIFVKSVSRFGRNIAESIGLINEMRDLGVSIMFESENIDTLKPGYEVLLAVLTSIAEQEARNTSENVRKHFRQRFQEGRFLYNFSQTLGYTKDDNGNFIIVPEEAEIVRRIYREYLAGASITQISRQLMQDGIKTASNKEPYKIEWDEEKRDRMLAKRTWYPSTIRQMLTNEKYKGCALCQKTYKIDVLSPSRKKNNGQLEQAYLENVIPQIISTDVWDLTQAEMRKRKELRTFAGDGVGRYSSKYEMSGIIICGECGSKFRRHSNTTKLKGKEPTWVCINHKEHGNDACKMKFVLEEDLKRVYLEALLDIKVNIEEVQEILLENIKAEVDDRVDDEIEELSNKIQEIQKEMFSIMQAYGRKELTDKEYSDKVEFVNQNMEMLTAMQRDKINKKEKIKLSESRIKEITSIVKETNLLEYDPEIFKALVETINITEQRTAIIKFKSNIEIEKAL